MTICIGSLCEKRRSAVVIADRMVTNLGLSVEFERDDTKIVKLTDNCLAVRSGDPLVAEEVFEDVIEAFKGVKQHRISEITKNVEEGLCELRKRRIEDEFFKPRGITIEEYYKNQAHFSEQLASMFEERIEEYDSGVNILIIGVDDKGSHLYLVDYTEHPRTSRRFDSIGFCSVGIGTPHAQNSLISNKCSPNLPLREVLYLVYEAKKKAEIAPGVGCMTDIAYIDSKGCHSISPDTESELKKILEAKTELIKPHEEKIKKMIKNLVIK
jgi:20S proteasome alpha/beta subunit